MGVKVGFFQLSQFLLNKYVNSLWFKLPTGLFPSLKFCLLLTLTVKLVLVLLSRFSLYGVEEFLCACSQGPYPHLCPKPSPCHRSLWSFLLAWLGSAGLS